MTIRRNLLVRSAVPVLATLFTSAFAFAQAQQNQPALLTAIDADYNGTVTQNEYMAYREEVFERFDASRDGRDEWHARSQALFARRDKDDSGDLSPDELGPA
jgi:hypothetical protein